VRSSNGFSDVEAMRPGTASGIVLGLLLFVGLLVAAQFKPAGYTKIDVTVDGKGRVLSVVAADGERVVLSWRNSLFGLLVTEVFFVRDGLLVEDQVTFAAADGTPPPRVSARDVDDLFHTGGAFDARGLNRPFSQIVYRVGEIGDPKLQIGDRTLALKQEAGFGGRAILSAGRPRLYEMLWH
jgi:hypothetical protein